MAHGWPAEIEDDNTFNIILLLILSYSTTQSAFTFSKLTMETLEQGVTTDVVLVSLLLALDIFHSFFLVSLL